MQPELNKMKALITSVICLCIGSCSFVEALKNSPEANNQVDNSPEGIIYMTDPTQKQIVDVTDTLYLGDTFKLKLKTPHAGDLAIIDPADRFFYLVYNGKRDTGTYPLIRRDSFINQPVIKLPTDQAMASVLNKKLSHNQTIFTTGGIYEIRLGDRLDTLNGKPVEVASVFFIREKRRKHH